MAQIQITLKQEEILQLLSTDHDGAFRAILTACLNEILKTESQEQLKATPYERTEERTDCRNGYRERELHTRIGTITLKVPRHRERPFNSLIFDNYSRSEAALVATMAEMVVNGVSTRKISRVMEILCGTSFSKSTVSEVCKKLDKEVEEFRNRPIVGKYPFLIVDATYFKVREEHRVVSKAFMIAIGTNDQGDREILGFAVHPNESTATWTDFLQGLRKRGLSSITVVTSDAHEGIQRAIVNVFPGTSWQRCQFHMSRNIIDKTPKKYQAGLATELQEMFNAATIEEARKKRDSILKDYREFAEAAMQCLENGFESCMTTRIFATGIYRHFRTSNHIERLNKELKRRSKVIGVFPNEKSVLRLMGSVLIELHERNLAGRKMFSPDTFGKQLTPRTTEKLQQIAEEQKRWLAA